MIADLTEISEANILGIPSHSYKDVLNPGHVSIYHY